MVMGTTAVFGFEIPLEQRVAGVVEEEASFARGQPRRVPRLICEASLASSDGRRPS